MHLIDFRFDNETQRAEVTFADLDEVVIGTHLMRRHRLEIDFARRTLQLEKR